MCPVFSPESLMTETSSRPAWPVVLWHAIRPRTLPLSISPVLAGATVGWAESGLARPDVTVIAALSALSIQIGTNLHNDAVDTLNHTDGKDRVGPVRVTERGWMTPGQVLMAAHAAFALAVLCGVWLVIQGGWPIVVIGVVSVLAGYAYSAGPWPISRGPFGELLVTLFFGVVAVGGVTYLHTGGISLGAILMGVVVGLPAAAVLTVNNTRDRITDARAGRCTLAMCLGRRGATVAYAGFLAATLMGLVVVAMLVPVQRGALAGLLCLPLVLSLTRAFALAETPLDFNRALGRTGKFQGLLVIASCLGIIAWRVMV